MDEKVVNVGDVPLSAVVGGAEKVIISPTAKYRLIRVVGFSLPHPEICQCNDYDSHPIRRFCVTSYWEV